MGDRAFAVAAPRAWNSLPDVIRRSSTPATFKHSLKTVGVWSCLCVFVFRVA